MLELIVVLVMIPIVVGIPVGAVFLGFYTGNYSHGRWEAKNGFYCWEKTLPNPSFMQRATIRGYDSVKRKEHNA